MSVQIGIVRSNGSDRPARREAGRVTFLRIDRSWREASPKIAATFSKVPYAQWKRLV